MAASRGFRLRLTGLANNRGLARRINLVVPCDEPFHVEAGEPTLTLEDLLGSRGAIKSVVRRMRLDFSSQVTLALQTRDAQLAKDTYDRAEAMPSHLTIEQFNMEGYQFAGQIFPGSSLVVAYQGLSAFVVKMLKNGERERVGAFRDKLSLLSRPCEDAATTTSTLNADLLNVHPHIVPFKLWEDTQRGRIFMVMPRLRETLEPLRDLSNDHASVLITQLTSALRFLHGLDFVHGDVKPANICVSDGPPASFVLIDLGSIQQIGKRVNATPPYVPLDLSRSSLLASPDVDWWMLAVTLAEKCCGKNCLVVGEGRWSASAPPKATILEHLTKNLSPEIWAGLHGEMFRGDENTK